MDWWPKLADLDRLNILNAPKEDRARLLASKYSKPVEEIMVEIGNKTDMDYQEDFEMPENPTKLLPMRLIHNYCCLPLAINENEKLCLVTPWPPSEIMSRWVFAVSGKKKYDLEVITHGYESVDVPAGEFDCIVIEPVMSDDGIFDAKGKMKIWLTNDERRIPVQVKSSVAIGSISIELLQFKMNSKEKLLPKLKK